MTEVMTSHRVQQSSQTNRESCIARIYTRTWGRYRKYVMADVFFGVISQRLDQKNQCRTVALHELKMALNIPCRGRFTTRKRHQRAIPVWDNMDCKGKSVSKASWPPCKSHRECRLWFHWIHCLNWYLLVRGSPRLRQRQQARREVR